MINELETLRNNINVDFNNTYNIVSGYTTDLINGILHDAVEIE